MLAYLLNRSLPAGLEGLAELALDLRWTWSHSTDRLWDMLDADAWERTRNPYYILQSISQTRLEAAARDRTIREELQRWIAHRQRYREDGGWFARAHPQAGVRGIAYFSMEFGLGEALPIYSGGLGILAGDFLKGASDLGVPIVGIGFLYQQGYFRQTLDPEGRQGEAYPYNDPVALPVAPVANREGGWLRVSLELPGRSITLRVWQAQVGKVVLYLLDSNDPLNLPFDRGVTAQLYPADQQVRLIQELILGIGGWRVLEELAIDVDICHLNEGHAAFAVLARARGCMRGSGQSFAVALSATRAGNLFTTHTPVAAAFDRFPPQLFRPYAALLAESLQVPVDHLWALGRKDPGNHDEPFNMAFLALRGCGQVNGVSRLHGTVSRSLFQVLFPDWPACEVPIGHVTNGVHVSSWDSAEADAVWTCACGKERWLGSVEDLCADVAKISDEDVWNLRVSQRQALIHYARRRLVRQMAGRGAPAELTEKAARVLDPNALTLGFARRFAEYKRPNLLLQDPDRLAALLRNPHAPVQLVVAGKAHPNDPAGKALVQAMTRFAARADVWDRVVFLEDYDMALAEFLVAGIDVWLNTPRRPWEACGTSGMKVLVNGGLNLSVLDGWWAEAYRPEVGWALSGEEDRDDARHDAADAVNLYAVLEREVVPEFYDRDPAGIPRRWLERIRTSMAHLTPQFSSNRMVREYVESFYLPAAREVNRRQDHSAKLAQELDAWHRRVREGWKTLRFGDMQVAEEPDHWRFEVPVYLADLLPHDIQVELYADPLRSGEPPLRIAMEQGEAIPGTVHGYVYGADAPTSRPSRHFTPRVVPFHPDAHVPLEETLILWRR